MARTIKAYKLIEISPAEVEAIGPCALMGYSSVKDDLLKWVLDRIPSDDQAFLLRGDEKWDLYQIREV